MNRNAPLKTCPAPDGLSIGPALLPPGGYDLAVCILASGSKGNAIYLTDGETAILLDAGFSGKEILRRMALRGIAPESLTAILVSHEHQDHIRGVGVLSRRFKVPVFINEGTFEAGRSLLGPLKDVRHFVCAKPFTIGGIAVSPFTISHDAADPAGFTFRKNDSRIGVATDLGVATALVAERLAGCNVLVLEANHNQQMLQDGPYPWHLKQRIRSRTGHLSNSESRDLLAGLMSDDLRCVILAHLSEKNNLPALAEKRIREALCAASTALEVALQDRPGPVVHVLERG